ncbi:MAG: hypothetical protein ACK421_07260, partial [Pseudanabaenaceae cyanobacterium]
ENLKQFRLNTVREEMGGMAEMADAFMQQDCIFMIFNRDDEMEPEIKHFMHNFGWSLTDYYPHFGVLHPLEGDREFLYAEETLAITATLDVLVQFFRQYKKQFRHDKFPPLTATYTPSSVADPTPITIKTLVAESEEIVSFVAPDLEENNLIEEGLLPRGSLLRLTFFDSGLLEIIRNIVPYAVTKDWRLRDKEYPVLLVQNTRPEITLLINTLQKQEDLQKLGFMPLESREEVGLFITGSGNIYGFEEFGREWQGHPAFKHWKQVCQNNEGCIVLLAMGLKGKSKGNPRPSHILAYYEVDYIGAEDLAAQILHRRGKKLL